MQVAYAGEIERRRRRGQMTAWLRGRDRPGDVPAAGHAGGRPTVAVKTKVPPVKIAVAMLSVTDVVEVSWLPRPVASEQTEREHARRRGDTVMDATRPSSSSSTPITAVAPHHSRPGQGKEVDVQVGYTGCSQGSACANVEDDTSNRHCIFAQETSSIPGDMGRRLRDPVPSASAHYA